MAGLRSAIFSAQYRIVTVSVIALVSIAAFDALAVISLLPSIGGEFGEVARLSWVVTAYLVASTVAVVAAGPLIDGLGVQRCFRGAVSGYLVASLACSVAPNFGALVSARTVQGLGGGIVLSLALSTVGLSYPDWLRPRVVAATSVVWAVTAVLGPGVAAAFVATVGWRPVFLVSAGLATTAIALVWSRLPGSSRTGDPRVPFHVGSFVLLVLFVVVSLVAVSEISARSWLFLAAASALAISYWRMSRSAHGVVLEFRHFARMPFAPINLAGAACYGALLGINSFLPIYVHVGLGQSNHVAALSVTFLSAGWTVASIVSSRIVRHMGKETLTLIGYGIAISAVAAGLSVYALPPALPIVCALFFVKGLGLGAVALGTFTLMQEAADRHDMGRASASYQFFRTLAYSYAAALSGSILLLVAGMELGDTDPIRGLLSGEDVAAGGLVASSVANGFRMAQVGVLAFVGVGFVAAMIIRRNQRVDRT